MKMPLKLAGNRMANVLLTNYYLFLDDSHYHCVVYVVSVVNLVACVSMTVWLTSPFVYPNLTIYCFIQGLYKSSVCTVINMRSTDV